MRLFLDFGFAALVLNRNVQALGGFILVASDVRNRPGIVSGVVFRLWQLILAEIVTLRSRFNVRDIHRLNRVQLRLG